MMSLSAWLRRHITPVAKSEGFTRKEHVFRLTGEYGDCAVLEFRSHLLDPSREVFFAEASIVPTPERAWTYREGWETARHWLPTGGAAMAQWRLIPPPEFAYEPGAEGSNRVFWVYGPGADPDDCGRVMARMLREESIPQMRRLLDRDQLLAEVKAPSPSIHVGRRPGWAEVLLKVDRVSPAELEPLLERVERNYPVVDEFIAWARNYAAEQATTRR